MKTLILYHTRFGTTLKCAKKIAAKASNFDLVNFLEKPIISLNDYDVIYLGTPIYYGKINRKFKQFIKKNHALLLEKDVRIFTTGLDDENLQQTLSKNFDHELLAHATHKHCGGGYYFEQMNFIERLFVRRVGSYSESMLNIDDEKIKELTKK